MAAIALLSVAVIATAQVLAVCARQRMTSEQWLAAQLEAANVQEHIAAMPYEKVSPSTMELVATGAQFAGHFAARHFAH